MKLKIFGAFALVLAIAGAAAAFPPHHEDGRPASRSWQRPGASAEDRARFEEIRSVREAIGAELRKENPDKAQAGKLFIKELDLVRELRKKGFRDCIENHDHSRGPCGWIARCDARMSYGNSAWVAFINEIRKEKPNKVRVWEYYEEAENFYRTIELERFNATLENPKFSARWYGGSRGWHRPAPRGKWQNAPRQGETPGGAPFDRGLRPKHHGFGRGHRGFGHGRWGGNPERFEAPAD